MLQEEDEHPANRCCREDARQQFSSREGGSLIQVTNITSHTLGVVLWDDGQLEEYVFPMIKKMTPIPATAKNFFGTAKANMKNAIVRVVEGESTCRRMHAARHLRYRAAAVPAERFAGRADLRVQREPGARSRGARLRQPDRVSIERNTGLAPNEIEAADGRSGASLTVVVTMLDVSVAVSPVRCPTTRTSGTAGANTSRRTCTSGSASILAQNPSNE